MPDFPDLATPAAEATDPPAFNSLVERAHRRRRRRAVGGVVVAVALIGAIAGGVAAGQRPSTAPPVTPSSPSPSGAPSASPDQAARIDRIVRTGSLFSYAEGPDGSILSVWQWCTHHDSGCRAAWQLSTPSGTSSGPASGSVPVAYPAGDDIVVTSWDHLGTVVHADGTSTPLHRVHSLTPVAGDVVVRGNESDLLVDPRTASAAALPGPAGTVALADASVGADGTVYALPAFSGPGPVWIATLKKGRWTHQVLSRGTRGNLPAYVVTAGDHAAAFSSFDGATVLPVGVLGVTSDGGDSWTMMARSALPFGTIDSMAATSDGTLFIATAGGEELFRSTGPHWTRFERVPAPKGIGDLQPAGDRVLARTGTSRAPALIAFDSRGHPHQLPPLR